MQCVVEIDTCWLYLVEALVGRKTGEQVDWSVLALLIILLEVLAGLGACPRIRGPRDVEYISLLAGVGYVLKLAIVGFLSFGESFIRPCSQSGPIR